MLKFPWSPAPRRWLVLASLAAFAMTSGGCITTGEHKKIVKGWKDKLAQLQKEKDGVQSRLDQKKRELGDMTKDRDSWKKKQEKLAKIYAELKNENKTCNKQVRELSTRVTDLTAAKGGLKGDLRKAAARILALENLAKQRKAFLDKLRASFKALVTAGKLKVSMIKGQLVLQLAEKILFSSGSSRVKKAGREAIKDVTKILLGMNRRWQVTGHTDSRGNPKFNWNLSMRRAMAVLQVMLSNGMPPKQISAAGFGQFQPRAPNDTNENRALNRRTEIVLVPNLEELKLAQGPLPSQLCRTLAMLTPRLSPRR